MIIGLTGTKASGKGVVAEMLKEQGFEYSSTSDRVREEAVRRGIDNYTTKQLQDIGNDLRRDFGVGVLAIKTLEKLFNKENVVIDGIRNLGEIAELKKQNAIIIAVDAPQEQRFDRLIKRARPSDPKDHEGFIEMERRDLGLGEFNTGQQVSACMEKADYKILNKGTLEELKQDIKTILEREGITLTQKEIIKRPSWDEYFMKITSLVAERSTCLRHNVGAIIIKNKRIISTGYNGAARGIKDCTERGCLRDELNIPSGTRHEICRAIHAEQNAIIQAAIHGTSVEGGTIYSTHAPCIICAKMIVNAGIKEVVYYNLYPNEDSMELFKEAGVNIRKVLRPEKEINFKD